MGTESHPNGVCLWADIHTITCTLYTTKDDFPGIDKYRTRKRVKGNVMNEKFTKIERVSEFPIELKLLGCNPTFSPYIFI